MPGVTEQERLKALFAGDPSANFASYKQQEETKLAPTAYNDTRTGDAFTSFRSETPLLTQTQNPSLTYQQALRQRLESIRSIADNPNAMAAQAAQQRAAMQAAQQSAGFNATLPGPGGAPSYGPATTADERRQAVLNAAASQKGMPYSWGGGNAKGATQGGANTRSTSGGPVGFDCSGLVLYAFAQVGIKMPHYNLSQLAMGVRAPINRLQPGDLVGTQGHVAIYAGNGMMWESPTFGKQVRLVPVRPGMFGVHINY